MHDECSQVSVCIALLVIPRRELTAECPSYDSAACGLSEVPPALCECLSVLINFLPSSWTWITGMTCWPHLSTVGLGPGRRSVYCFAAVLYRGCELRGHCTKFHVNEPGSSITYPACMSPFASVPWGEIAFGSALRGICGKCCMRVSFFRLGTACFASLFCKCLTRSPAKPNPWQVIG